MPYSAQEQVYNPILNGGNSAYNADTGVHLERIVAKTAAYTVKDNEFGTTFTNRGATASVAFTLPVVTSLPTGWWCRFFGLVNAGFSVLSNGSSDNIATKNDATADSITMTTNSLAIGCNVLVIWDGTSWLAISGISGTYTVA